MLLSAAIRKGAQFLPMATGRYFGYTTDGIAVSSCALGAAYQGVTGRPASQRDDEEGVLSDAFPYLDFFYNSTPKETDICLYDIITGMNDSGCYTREEIADWLESCGL